MQHNRQTASDEGDNSGQRDDSSKAVTTLVIGAVCLGTAVFSMFHRYKISRPNEYLVRTGAFLQGGMKISKNGFLWPFQEGTMVEVNPVTYEFDLSYMSKEKIEFKLPINLTVRPIHPDGGQSVGFTSFLKNIHGKESEDVTALVKGWVEGETRTLAASLTVEEVFKDKEIFRNEVVDKLQEQLKVVGLEILNANIKEMRDIDEKNKYFDSVKRRAVETASAEAEIAVALALRNKNIGLKEQEMHSRISIAKSETDAIRAENEREQEISSSKADLHIKLASNELLIKKAHIESDMEAKRLQAERDRELAIEMQKSQLETLRQQEWIRTKISAEQAITEAEAAADVSLKQANALYYTKTKQAEADADVSVRESDALYYAKSKEAEGIKILAEAHLVSELKRAEGVSANLEAQASGLEKIKQAAGGSDELAKFYIGATTGLYEKLAIQHAAALQGLEPKMNIWTTGESAGNDPMRPVINAVQSLAPLLDGLQKQAPHLLPEFLKGEGRDKK